MIDRINIETLFDEAELISAYHVAFLISDFEESAIKRQDGIDFRAFARPGLAKHSSFGLNTTIAALEHFESAFKTKYDLPKLDQVALPVSNLARGMTAHGLIFYREDYFLFEPTVSTKILSANSYHKKR